MNLLTIYQLLFDRYGPRHWWPAETPFEMAVGAILTQNTNWRNVEQAIANLRQADALSAAALCALPRPELEALITHSGFFRQKAERLQLFGCYLRGHYQGRLEKMLRQPLAPLREELLRLKGIGPETADSILLYGGDYPSFVVDAYTGRLFNRLGFLQGTEKYQQIRDFFMDRLPPDPSLYNEYHALIVIHCKEHCRKRPLCPGCPLERICAYRQLNP
jgi:endonuclease-3 related protein